MNQSHACPQCGALMRPGEPCPACLLAVGLATQTLLPGEPGTARMPCPGEDFGPYRIISRLGGGGMGEVFEAEHRENRRRVALKVIGQELASPEDRERFLREGRLAAGINHPHVVYVFGSEEIEGAPAIAMELLPGGTLKDRVIKDRPLPPAEAVDAILQVIEGLAAAQVAGVLHRDVKPANCFLDPEGRVKIGDFGLSIPADGRRDAQVTAPGSLLGSPAFASPEQLRGQPLDVRSDIYSVGATLYYLLTAATPHEGDSVVNVIAAALEKTPPSPRERSPAVPADLSRLVMRCLAKKPENRFVDYDALMDALRPYSSASPAPAPPGLRFLAGLMDAVLLFLFVEMPVLFRLGSTPDEHFLSSRTPAAIAVWLFSLCVMILFYSAAETRWGCTPGKSMCGIRVMRTNRSRAGFPRLLARAAIFTLLPALCMTPDLLLMSGPEYARAAQEGIFVFGDYAFVVGAALLFLSMRRRNGWAGLHELLTGTRVVMRPRRQQRIPLGTWQAPASAPAEAAQFGPYQTVGELARLEGGSRLLLARDEALRRGVWVLIHPAGTPALPADRHALARPGRLRWLNGERTGVLAWDAFDAPDGCGLLALLDGSPALDWSRVRFWLADLAQELAAGWRDGSLPPLSLNHLWITAAGRARLLEFPAPGSAASPASATHPATAAGAQAFLAEVASACLAKAPPPPLSARRFLDSLRKGVFPAVEMVAGNLIPLTESPPAISRARRLGSLALAPALAAFLGATWVAFSIHQTGAFDRAWERANPDRPSPRQVVTAWWEAGDKPALQREIGVYFLRQYAKELSDAEWVRQLDFIDAWNAGLPWVHDVTASGIAAAHQDPKQASLEAPDASRRVLAALEGIRLREKRLMMLSLLVFFPGCLLPMAVLGLLCALLGTSPWLRLFGIAVVDRHGQPASRWRLLGRWAVTWPGLAGFSFLLGRMLGHLYLGHRPDLSWMFHTGWPISYAVCGAVMVLVMACSPSRGFQDEQAGTWLVPRE